MDLAVQVKREISELWWKTDRPPYTDLFNDSLTSVNLWKAVLVLRTVDEELQKLRRTSSPRADMIAVHLNRALLSLVFQDLSVRAYRSDSVDEKQLIESARAAINEIFPRAAAYVEDYHPADYLASFCKNREKCNDLEMAIVLPVPSASKTGGSQLSFFDKKPIESGGSQP